MKKYIIFLALLSALMALGIFITGKFISAELVDSVTWMLLLYFIFVTLAFHYGLVRSAKGRTQVFIRYYMATTTFKLLLHMGVIIIYALFNKEDAIRVISSFLVFYIIFTAFEVALAWKQFRTS
ncbi:MAG: hypothetical protein EYC69_08870 [Bacteroidetes bacterium]|nr:MAG: hypothetical protein EYC69_08870 [Bacteroidota bacterium]